MVRFLLIYNTICILTFKNCYIYCYLLDIDRMFLATWKLKLTKQWGYCQKSLRHLKAVRCSIYLRHVSELTVKYFEYLLTCLRFLRLFHISIVAISTPGPSASRRSRRRLLHADTEISVSPIQMSSSPRCVSHSNYL